MQGTTAPLTKRIAHIARCTQFYMDDVLKPYHLSSGTYPFLLALWQNEGINLEKISRKVNVDKSMSTRSIQKLVSLGYLEKLSDPQDLRCSRLYLTDKAKKVIPFIKKDLAGWIGSITLDLTQKEKDSLDDMLGKILERAQKQTWKDESQE